MASLFELKDALLETLEARGVLGEMKARIQSEIFQSLDDASLPRPQIPPENLLINELIREYLTYNQCFHTLSVFLAESGHPEVRCFDRKFIADELKIADCLTDSENNTSNMKSSNITRIKSCDKNTNSNARQNNSKLPLLYALTQKPRITFTGDGKVQIGGNYNGGGRYAASYRDNHNHGGSYNYTRQGGPGGSPGGSPGLRGGSRSTYYREGSIGEKVQYLLHHGPSPHDGRRRGSGEKIIRKSTESESLRERGKNVSEAYKNNSWKNAYSQAQRARSRDSKEAKEQREREKREEDIAFNRNISGKENMPHSIYGGLTNHLEGIFDSENDGIGLPGKYYSPNSSVPNSSTKGNAGPSDITGHFYRKIEQQKKDSDKRMIKKHMDALDDQKAYGAENSHEKQKVAKEMRDVGLPMSSEKGRRDGGMDDDDCFDDISPRLGYVSTSYQSSPNPPQGGTTMPKDSLFSATACTTGGGNIVIGNPLVMMGGSVSESL